MARPAADFAILTALPEELSAVLAALPDHRKIEKDGSSVYTYYEATVQSARAAGDTYRVVVSMLTKMGPEHATAAAADLVRAHKPRCVLMVGIAGGVPPDVSVGDVLIADQVADYVNAKVKKGRRTPRWEGYQANALLLDSALHLSPDWRASISVARPESGVPHVHKGVVASGGDVIADSEIVRSYQNTWPKLVGVEMEGGGVALALHQTPKPPGMLMIRGVSDLADEHKSTPAVQSYRPYACSVAAAFAVALIRSGPLRGKRAPKARSAANAVAKAVGRIASDPPPATGVEPDPKTGFVPPEAALSFLAEEARAGRLIVVAGSLVPASAGVTLRRRLGERLSEPLKKKAAEDEVAQLADMFVDEQEKALADRRRARIALIKLVRDMARQQPPAGSALPFGELAPKLVSLPLNVFYTTTLDNVLERCLLDASPDGVEIVEESVADACDEPRPGGRRQIVYLHGSLQASPDHWILQAQDHHFAHKIAPGVFAHLSRSLRSPATLLCVGLTPAELLAMGYFEPAPGRQATARILALLPDATRQVADALTKQRISVIAGLTPADCAAYSSAFLDALNRAARGEPPQFVPPTALVPAPPSAEQEIDKILENARARARRSGARTGRDWFRSYPAPTELRVQKAPPTHELLSTVFIDRNLRAPLLSDLRRKEKRGITGLWGMGGIGKTFLAMRIAKDLAAEGWEIVWVGLLQQGAEEALDSLAAAYGLEMLDNLKLEEKVAALTDLFEDVATHRPATLVVLDNAEKFPNLPMLLRPLMSMPVLVTSRTRECGDIVRYERMDEMTLAEALGMCKAYLNQYAEGWYDKAVKKKSRDLEDLKELVEALGCHPLGIRLVLAGFARRGRYHHIKPRPFATILEEIKARGAEAIPEGREVGRGDAGESLHRTIFSTFEWLFRDLPARSPDHGQSAQLLLPVLAALAHTPVPKELVSQTVGALMDRLEKVLSEQPPKSDKEPNTLEEFLQRRRRPTENRLREGEKPLWWPELLALRDPGVLDSALEDLVRVSLAEVDDTTGRLGVHPLIRQFAFAERQLARPISMEGELPVLTETGPAIAAIYQSVLQTLKGAEQAEALLDLLPRLRRMRALVEQAFDTLRQADEALRYKKPDWIRYCEMLRILIDLVRDLEMKEHTGWLLCTFGELKSRMEDPEGLVHFREGLALLEGTKLEARWARSRRQWAGAYLSTYYSERPPTEELPLVAARLRHALKHLVVTSATITVLEEFLQTHLHEGAASFQLGLCCRSDFLSNLVNDLTRWLDHSVEIDGAREAPSMAERLFQVAQNKAKTDADASVAISPETELHFLSTLYEAKCDLGLIPLSEAPALFGDLIERARRFGIRGVYLRQTLLDLQWRHAIKAGRLQDAISLAEELYAIAQDRKAFAESRVTSERLGLLCTRLAAGHEQPEALSAIERELSEIRAKITARSWSGLVGWLLLTEGLLHAQPSRLNSYSACRALIQARCAFVRHDGAEPMAPFHLRKRARELIDGTTGRATYDDIVESLPAPERAPLDLQPWAVWGRTELPERVISIKDGRRMRLVRAGFHAMESGEEAWLYPFYIDEEPVSLAEFEAFLKAEGRPSLSRPASGTVLTIDRAGALAYAAWAQKRLPIAVEHYAATWQLAAGKKPEVWTSYSDALQRTVERIERALTGDTKSKLSPLDGPQKRSARSPEPPPAPSLEAPPKAPNAQAAAEGPKSKSALRVFFDHHMAGGPWREGSVRDAYAEAIEKPLVNHRADFPLEKAEELAYRLASSISLSIEEKQRIVSSLPKLRLSQKEELLRVFQEEERKFADLNEAHEKQLVKLALQYEADLLAWIAPDTVMFQGVEKEQLAGIWEDASRFPEEDKNACLGGDCFSDPVYYGPRAAEAIDPVGVRCVLLIFSAEDLKLVRPA